MHARSFGLLRIGGMDLHYAAQGRPDGPALILLHGYTDSCRSYEPLMDALSDRFRIVALSMRGHGDSDRPAGGYDIVTLVDDVVGALDLLNIGQATIVGHSMGSLVAQQIATTRKRRVSRLVLIGAFVTLKGNQAVEALWHDAVADLRDPVDPAFVAAFQQSSVAGPLPAGFLDSMVAESLKVPARVWRAMLRALIDEDDPDRPREIIMPTLIIWGAADAFASRAEQWRLALEIPDARLVIQAGIGHAPHWENARRVAADIVSFVDETSVLAA